MNARPLSGHRSAKTVCRLLECNHEKCGEIEEWKFSGRPQTPVMSFLKRRQVGRRPHAERHGLQDFAARKTVQILKEREFDTSELDKIFSAVWLSDNHVLMGTKCDKLILLDITTGSKQPIPTVTVPEEILYAGEEELSNGDATQRRTHCRGIHSIALNPSKTLLAIGAGRPTEVTVFKVKKNGSSWSFEPYAICKGHKDMIFSAVFVDDSTIASGSRDTTIKIWNLNNLESRDEVKSIQSPLLNNDTVFIVPPTLERQEHTAKVRDMAYSKQQNKLYSLGGDGYMKVFDVQRYSVVNEVPLRYTNETVCLEDSEHNLFAIGSQNHISLLDPRDCRFVHDFESLDEAWGVRSMDVSRSMITIGGGLGRLSFYDLRAMKYLPCNLKDDHHDIVQEYDDVGNPVESNDNKNDHMFLKAGKGFLQRDQTFLQHFSTVTVSNAIYTLAYNENRTKLFTAGGPLHLHFKGSYAAVW